MYILSSRDAFREGKGPLIPADNFKDTVVYLAYYAQGLFDICSTPVSQVYPGESVHITTYDNILNNNFIRKVSESVGILYFLMVAFMGALIITVTKK
ncbi:MAG: CHASE2 domain-containing protein [Treponema sp.]|nr:CHASE2 domain-containing protein [Treponema sp.]